MFKLLIAASVALVAASSADSYAGQYNINISSCVADSGAVENALYHGSAGTVNFAGTKTGDIVLYCPIPYQLSFTPSEMALLYTNTDPAGHVEIQLIEMSSISGAIFVDASATGSDYSGSKATASTTSFTYAYDPSAYAYYVRVDLVRTSTTLFPTGYLLHIEG